MANEPESNWGDPLRDRIRWFAALPLREQIRWLEEAHRLVLRWGARRSGPQASPWPQGERPRPGGPERPETPAKQEDS